MFRKLKKVKPENNYSANYTNNTVGVDSTDSVGFNHRGVDTNINSNDNGTDVVSVMNTDDDTEWNFLYGYCPQCKKANHSFAWCNRCDRKALVDKFNTWSTGNEALNLFIQESQRTATCYTRRYVNYKTYLEYVPYDRLTNVKSLGGLGNFTAETWLDSSRLGEVFTATWLDGERKIDHDKKIKGLLAVSLETVVNSTKIDHVFIDELQRYYQSHESDIYGITLDLETMNYALVLKNDKRYSSGYCPQCKKANHDWMWCNPCDRKALVDKFNTWSTGNKALDSFIQKTQRTATFYYGRYGDVSYLEYVPYDRLTVKSLGGDFTAGEVLTATWLDGERVIKGDMYEYIRGRSPPLAVSLKMVVSATKIDHVFIDELQRYYQSHKSDIYGITLDPETMNYALVFKNKKYGYCPQCKIGNYEFAWCNFCDRKALVDKFNTWSTGNKDLDLFIQETQRTATSCNGYLEYVPYDRFTDVESLGGLSGDFTASDFTAGKVLMATWLDGKRVIIEREGIKYSWIKERSEPLTVFLVASSTKIDVFIKELIHYHQSCEYDTYGVTLDQKMNYALVYTKRNFNYGYCPQCKKANNYLAWCNRCDQKALIDKFNTWSTGNKDLDLFIQETQETARSYRNYLEYVPYDQFTVKSLGGLCGDFTAGEVFTATWLDGERKVMKETSNNYIKGRSEPLTASLEMIVNSTKIDHVFIDKLQRYYQSRKSNIYGITFNPETMNYALVFNSECGYCPQCEKENTNYAWCYPCDRKALVDKFNTWSTGNKALDLFIQETQRTATSYELGYGDNYLEYVPYDRFTDVKSLARGGFAEVFTATWSDGTRVWKEVEDDYIKGRTEPCTVALKMIDNSAKMEQSFVNELKLHYRFYRDHVPCYGITKDPETMNYALILQYFPDGDLRKSLTDSDNKLTRWKDRFDQLTWICYNLKDIHNCNYVHCDIHSGNILLGKDEFSSENSARLTDFGLTRPADSSRSTRAGTYGVIPYMAPELFRGEPHSKASDIYAIGIIMSEIASNELAFYDRDHDVFLQLAIIDGLRPEVPPETPKCYKDLMDRCLSGNPSDRPTVKELHGLFAEWYLGSTEEAEQFEMADEQWKQKRPKKRHPSAIYTSRLIAHVTTNINSVSSAHVGASTSSRLPTSRNGDLEITIPEGQCLNCSCK